jgi:hypothetical protein
MIIGKTCKINTNPTPLPRSPNRKLEPALNALSGWNEQDANSDQKL